MAHRPVSPPAQFAVTGSYAPEPSAPAAPAILARSAARGTASPLPTLAAHEVVILCGGQGVRMRQDIPNVPKPLVEVAARPILWHVMQLFAQAGPRRFVLCLGYRGKDIQRAFRGRDAQSLERRRAWGTESWHIACRPTGLHTNTGERLKRVAAHVSGDVFFATYGDGLADVDLNKLLAFHRRHGRIATLTCVQPPCPFGVVEADASGAVRAFTEKPPLRQWINGGFFVFDRRIFDVIKKGDALESDTFGRLASASQLMAYRHRGFWRCMDTYKDSQVLNQLCKQGAHPWLRRPSPGGKVG